MVEDIVPEVEAIVEVADLAQMYTRPIIFHPPEEIAIVTATIMTVHVTSHVASLSRNNVLHMNHFISEK
jgi:hypothetical protein